MTMPVYTSTVLFMSLCLNPHAKREFLDLPTNIAGKIAQALQTLATSPRSHQSIKLSGGEGYRLRSGDYRILYEIDDLNKKVEIYRIKHRREAYR
jgi:mRNA interferase RelE/StbE